MKICVLGSHPATRDQAPFDLPDWEIWACSPHNAPPHKVLPRVTRWYEVHPKAADPTREPAYLDYLQKLCRSIPVYMMDRSDHPAIQYPKEDMVSRYGAFFIDTSSIAYIMAHAIATIEDDRVASGPSTRRDVIGIWGCMQASAGEYVFQLPGIQYYCQMAHDRGIDVAVPEDTHLLKPRVLNF